LQEDSGMTGTTGTGELRKEVNIRLWSDLDFPLLQRLMGDPAMTEHLGGPETPDQLRERHTRYLNISQSDKGSMFVIVVGRDKVPVGSVGYWERDWQGQMVWETGWSVLPEFQGQGIATRAMIALLVWVRTVGKHQFIHAFPSVDNPPSNTICRKVGFTLLGESKFEYPPGNWLSCNDWQLDLVI
jgi:RimJ/RimL family protein N-acetyltransferase